MSKKNEVNFLKTVVEMLDQNYETDLNECRVRYKTRLEKAEKLAQIIPQLQASGLLKRDAATFDVYSLTIDVDREQLPFVHKVIGSMKLHSREPYGDGRSQKIRVVLASADWPIRVRYIAKLPRNSKCKVVTTKTKETSLICSR